MDPSEKMHRQNLRIIVSEAIMVIAVVAMATILAFVVSGYWIGADFTVERQGMLQIYSVPTGASIEVDGDAPWFQRTNTSKILSSGEHSITLKKDGYDTWSKTIYINEGLLYRLSYPHLFPNERVKEAVYTTPTGSLASVSPNRKLMLLVNNTLTWELINLDRDTIKSVTLDVSSVFTDTNQDLAAPEAFDSKIISLDWDNANEHVLIQCESSSGIEWILLNIRNVAQSINLTREFNADFQDIKIYDNSATQLLVLRSGNLHKIDVDSRQISSILFRNVESYDFYDSDIVVSSDGVITFSRLGSVETETVQLVNDSAKVLFYKFYNEKYIFVADGTNVNVYLKDGLELLISATINFVPSIIKAGYGGEFIVMIDGVNFATLDMESMQISSWTTDSNQYGWLNGYMIYAVNNGELFVYDFDGLNRRSLAFDVSGTLPVTITGDKWLYYFSGHTLIREWLVR